MTVEWLSFNLIQHHKETTSMDITDSQMDLLKRRDLVNFIRIRTAHPGDDLAVGDLLVKSFKETYAKKLPSAYPTPEREIELRDVNSRRLNGIVRLVELGYQIIATYALIHPRSPISQAWLENACTLRCLAIDPRFHSLKLSDKLIRDAIELCKQWTSSAICLHVQVGATGVASLYESFGFVRDPRGDCLYLGNPIEAYVFQFAKDLSA